MKKIIKYFLGAAILFGVLAPTIFVQAQESWLKIYPDCIRKQMESKSGENFDPKCDDVGVFIELAINIGAYLFTFIGALALLVFVYGGFKMIISAGDSAKIKEGKNAMVAAVIGIVIAFSGVAIVRFLGEALHIKEEYKLNEASLGKCSFSDNKPEIPNITESQCKGQGGSWTKNEPKKK